MADRLICMESNRVTRAFEDPVLLNDHRVLDNLLKTEDRYAVPSSYFNCVQADIKPFMRRMVTEWMAEVCVEVKSEEEVFPLAVNYLDRFLGIQAIPRTRLQCLGAACMLLASKLKENYHVSAEQLVIYTDHSITLSELREMESTVLQVLKWDLSAITPCDFVAQLVHRLTLDPRKVSEVKRHAQIFIRYCVIENEVMLCTPSMVAASCVCVSIHAVIPTPCPSLLHTLHTITGIEMDVLKACFASVQQIVSDHLSGQTKQHNLANNQVIDNPVNKAASPPMCQSTTPTDVRDINLLGMDNENQRRMNH